MENFVHPRAQETSKPFLKRALIAVKTQDRFQGQQGLANMGTMQCRPLAVRDEDRLVQSLACLLSSGLDL